MPTRTEKQTGALLGSFIADALALGPHWIYDTDVLSKRFGYIQHYSKPGPDSYHPHKEAGEQSHVGDQALRLAAWLRKAGQWNAETFMDDWLAMWSDYSDYFDKATKTTLQNVESGAPRTEAGSRSEELAGAARVAPLIAYMADQSEDALVQASLQQTRLTHISKKSDEAATFLASATFHLFNGNSLKSTIQTCAPRWALDKASRVLNFDSVEAIGELGQSCSIEAALPSVLYLALKYSNDFTKALSENAMAGGDTCARGLALGLLIGADQGLQALPKIWIHELKAAPLLFSLTNAE